MTTTAQDLHYVEIDLIPNGVALDADRAEHNATLPVYSPMRINRADPLGPFTSADEAKAAASARYAEARRLGHVVQEGEWTAGPHGTTSRITTFDAPFDLPPTAKRVVTRERITRQTPDGFLSPQQRAASEQGSRFTQRADSARTALAEHETSLRGPSGLLSAVTTVATSGAAGLLLRQSVRHRAEALALMGQWLHDPALGQGDPDVAFDAARRVEGALLAAAAMTLSPSEARQVLLGEDSLSERPDSVGAACVMAERDAERARAALASGPGDDAASFMLAAGQAATCGVAATLLRQIERDRRSGLVTLADTLRVPGHHGAHGQAGALAAARGIAHLLTDDEVLAIIAGR